MPIKKKNDDTKDVKEQKTETNTETKKTIKDNKQETKTESANKTIAEDRKVYLVDYYIKDLTIDKIIETNLEKYKKQSYAVVFRNGPKIILGQMKNVFPKIDDALSKMKIDEEKTIKLAPIDAYGARNKELLKVVPANVFKQNNIRPVVGLTIETSGVYGTIRSISGGRILVDFNSSYADHEIEFYIKLIKLPEGKEKVDAIIKTLMPSVSVKELKYDATKKTVDLLIDKTKYKEDQMKGLEQILIGIIKPYINIEKLTIAANQEIPK